MATTAGGLMEVVGVFGDVSHVKVTSPGTTSVAVKMPGLTLVKGAIVQVLSSGNNVVTSDADITWSGDTITIADGSTFTLADTYVIYIIAWGDARR